MRFMGWELKRALLGTPTRAAAPKPQGPSPGYGLPWVPRDVEPGSFLAAASRRPVACAASLLAPSLRHETDQRHTGGRPGVITWAVPQFVRSLWLNANPACSRWLCSRRDDRSADLELTDGLIVPNRMRPAGVRLAHTMTMAYKIRCVGGQEASHWLLQTWVYYSLCFKI